MWDRICLPFQSSWDTTQPLVGGVHVTNSLVFYVLFWVLLFVSLSVCLFLFSHGTVSLFRLMSLNVPLMSWAPLLHHFHCLGEDWIIKNISNLFTYFSACKKSRALIFSVYHWLFVYHCFKIFVGCLSYISISRLMF